MFAGGGPENVLLVVNARSPGSKAIANHYRSLRQVPDANTLFLDWDGVTETITVDVFREKILRPIFTAIDKRKMSSQIDYIVYSSDFPYAVNFGDEVPTVPPGKFTKGSLTGLTFLAPLVMAKTSYSGERMNWYVRPVTPAGIQTQPTRGFRFEHYWNNKGELSGPDGMRFIMSAMLGYTGGRGNSIEEVLRYLEQSAKADHTYPKGTIYFSKNDDIRSTVRDSWYSLAVQELRQLGVRAEILSGDEGVTPKNRKDVMGATLGRANLRWASARNEILPGAFCDNFTSYGGILAEGSSQTPLTELLRHGAAGATGTIVEPFAKPGKFPTAYVHVHYARGCSLAESVYQTVRGPYQLLLVGDPLCQPWARPPSLTVAGISDNEVVQGIVEVTPQVDGSVAAKYCEVFLEGRRVGRVKSGEKYALDTTQIPDGYHELRIVAIADDLIEAQSRRIVQFVSNNQGREISFRLVPKIGRLGKPIVVQAESPGAQGIAVYSGRQLLARSGGEKCRLIVNTSRLGLGMSKIQVIGLHDKDVAKNIFSSPIGFQVSPQEPLPALPPPVGLEYQEGVKLSNVLATTVLKKSSDRYWPKNAGLNPGESFSLEGVVEVPRDGLYQIQLRVTGDATVRVDSKIVASVRNQKGQVSYQLVSLQKGWHVVKADVKLTERLLCSLTFGGAGRRALGAADFRVAL